MRYALPPNDESEPTRRAAIPKPSSQASSGGRRRVQQSHDMHRRATHTEAEPLNDQLASLHLGELDAANSRTTHKAAESTPQRRSSIGKKKGRSGDATANRIPAAKLLNESESSDDESYDDDSIVGDDASVQAPNLIDLKSSVRNLRSLLQISVGINIAFTAYFAVMKFYPDLRAYLNEQ